MNERLGYRSALDGIRGVAIVAVVVCHAGAVDGGYLGVDIFFVLSGFLITTLLLEEWHETGAIGLRGFYRRRAARLLPALVTLLTFLFLLVGVAVAVGATPADALVALAVHSLEALFYAVNIAYATGHPPVLLSHLWSLAEEEQFYLVWPPLLLVALRRRMPLRRLAVVLAAAAVVLAGSRAAVYELGGSWDWLLTSPQTRSDSIVIGCLAAVIRKRSPGVPTGARGGNIAMCAFVALVATMSVVGFSRAALAYVLLPFAATVAVLVVGVVDHPMCAVARLLSWPPLRFVGRISYSWYLWHFMFVTGHHGWDLAAGVLVSLVLAWLSYRYVEMPLRRKLTARGHAGGSRDTRTKIGDHGGQPFGQTVAPVAVSSSSSRQ